MQVVHDPVTILVGLFATDELLAYAGRREEILQRQGQARKGDPPNERPEDLESSRRPLARRSAR
jgi:hypothetical protein